MSTNHSSTKEPLEMQHFAMHGGDIITSVLANLSHLLGWLV
ncbi:MULTISPECIES: hypothetical protein [Prauserella salsuginis group]|uniref:Uncharacterized protein n=2 Tax=Prauserella salsuginis group TaxID=2893672 RepID=A0A839XVG2_9PSEU|nr:MULTISPECIES: hypothetical protein [Prauserella salsuginis group]MBB3663986.1 hypothetical protein [Prauserella sediminis]